MKDTLEALALAEETRAALLASPEAILEDQDVMQALIAANDAARGENVIDMRGLAMRRLEERLCRLEDTHQNLIAAAYENLAGTQLIHRATLELIGVADAVGLAALLDGRLAETLRVDCAVLVLEGEGPGEISPGLLRAEPGWIAHYLAPGGRGALRRVTLRRTESELYGAGFVGSEAALALDLGPGRLPGMLGLAVADPDHYHPGQGTELLEFLASAMERVLERLGP